MESRTIFYLLSGIAHAPYLLVSLRTLRQNWQGHVEVWAWPESFEIARRICEDKRLDARCFQREPPYRKADGVGGNSQFLHKQLLAQQIDATVGLYIDCDTSIHGNLSPLLDAASEYGFAATQFNDWSTTDRMVAGRLRELYNVPEIDRQAIDQCLTMRWPSVNGGVWAARRESPILPLWNRLTLACGKLFISDERVLHILQPMACPPEHMATVCESGKLNTSPKFQSKALPDDQVVVMHYHGDSATRPEKSPRGYGLWWPLFEECRELNIGGVNDWLPEAVAANKHLRRVMDDGPERQ